jgi:hypothetical protein
MSLNFRINSKNGVRGSHSYCEKRHSSSTEIGLEAVRVAGLPSRWIDSRRLRCMAAHTNGHQVGFCSTHQDSAYCHVRSYTAIDQTRCDCTLWETGSRSCEALRGLFLAAMTVLESGLSNQNSIRMADRIRADLSEGLPTTSVSSPRGPRQSFRGLRIFAYRHQIPTFKPSIGNFHAT